jgi:hypothetical protein
VRMVRGEGGQNEEEMVRMVRGEGGQNEEEMVRWCGKRMGRMRCHAT